jgi:transcriptional regulator with XRE-family HTH domain
MRSRDFASRLKNLQEGLGFETQRLLAQRLGISEGYLSLLLAGKRKPGWAVYQEVEGLEDSIMEGAGEVIIPETACVQIGPSRPMLEEEIAQMPTSIMGFPVRLVSAEGGNGE